MQRAQKKCDKCNQIIDSSNKRSHHLTCSYYVCTNCKTRFKHAHLFQHHENCRYPTFIDDELQTIRIDDQEEEKKIVQEQIIIADRKKASFQESARQNQRLMERNRRSRRKREANQREQERLRERNKDKEIKKNRKKSENKNRSKQKSNPFSRKRGTKLSKNRKQQQPCQEVQKQNAVEKQVPVEVPVEAPNIQENQVQRQLQSLVHNMDVAMRLNEPQRPSIVSNSTIAQSNEVPQNQMEQLMRQLDRQHIFSEEYQQFFPASPITANFNSRLNRRSHHPLFLNMLLLGRFIETIERFSRQHQSQPSISNSDESSQESQRPLIHPAIIEEERTFNPFGFILTINDLHTRLNILSRRQSFLFFPQTLVDFQSSSRVQRGLTQQQINTIPLRISQIDQENTCSICCQNFMKNQAIRVLKGCEHNFHRGCIDIWFGSKSVCPNCRRSQFPDRE